MELKMYKGHGSTWVLKGPNDVVLGRFSTKREAETARVAFINAQKAKHEVDKWVTSYSAQQ